MTQEEKAKAYDEALKKAKQFHDKDLFAECNGNLVEYIFPELKESEDEKIRKALMKMIYDTPLIECEKIYKISKEKCIAWLEKQGEQKPTLRERYENISKSEWFKRTHEGMSCGLDEEQLQVDDFDAELNALLKKYEHLPKEEVAERLRRKMILYVHLLT